MKKSQNKRKMDGSGSLLLSIIVVFGILGAIVFSVAHKISVEMSGVEVEVVGRFVKQQVVGVAE